MHAKSVNTQKISSKDLEQNETFCRYIAIYQIIGRESDTGRNHGFPWYHYLPGIKMSRPFMHPTEHLFLYELNDAKKSFWFIF